MARFTTEDLEKNIDRPEVFEYVGSDGTVFQLKHPKALHYTVWTGDRGVGAAGTLRFLLGGAQYEKFAALPEMDGYLTDALLDEYNKHYGLGDEGESDASST